MSLDNLFSDFESELSGADINLSALPAKPAIKTPEEIRNEWLALRRGYFTASCAGQLMGFEDKDELPDGAKTYAKKVAIERITKFNADRIKYKSKSMEWGNDTELDAIAAFEAKTGFVVSDTGENQKFIKLDYWIGGTPDGIINLANSGAEIKCPDSKTHWEYLQIDNQVDFKRLCKDYYWQIQQLMFCTGSSFWYFISFDPDFIGESKRLKIIRIERNEKDISKLIKRLGMAINYAKSLIN